jgi:type IV pilus biogenesis/stability protein PilW
VSLIIGALKKAQQLRSQETKRVPFFQDIQPGGKKKAKAWALAGMASALGLAAFLAVYPLGGKPSPPPDQAYEAGQQVAFPEPELSLPALDPRGKDLSRELAALGPSPKVDPSRRETAAQGIEGPLQKASVKEEITPRANPPEAKLDPPRTAGSQTILQKEERGSPPSPKGENEEGRSLPEPESFSVDPLPKSTAQEGKEVFPSPPSTPPENASRPAWTIKKEGENEVARAAELLSHFNQGVHFASQKEISKALQAYQKVLEIDPKYVEAHNNLGLLYQEMGDGEKAQKAYQTALGINPNYEKALNNLGILYYGQGHYEDSLDCFRKALGVNPQNVEGHINLGVLYLKRGQSDQAADSFQRALSLNPRKGEIHYNLARVYEQAQKTKLAVEHYHAFIHLSARTHPALVQQVRQHVNRLRSAEKEKKP